MIIALTGLQGVGKSTVMNIIKDHYKKKNVSTTNIKFAQPLYDIQELIYKRIKRPNPTRDRVLLQDIGMWGRTTIHENLWLDLWKTEIEIVQRNEPSAILLCDDLRFENEAEAVKDMRGIVLKVEADYETRAARISLQNTQHASEQGIHPRYIYAIILNNNTKQELEWDVINALEGLINNL